MARQNTIVLGAVVAGTKIEQASGTTIAVPYPAGVRLDHVLAIYVSVFNTTTQPTKPASLTQDDARGIAAGTAAPWHLLAHGKATATDVTASRAAGSMSVTVPNNVCSAIMLAVPEVDLMNMLDVAVTTYEPNTGQTTCNLPAQTLTRPGCLVITGVGNVSTGNTWTPGNLDSVAMTEDADNTATRSFQVCHGLSGAPGSTGTITHTSSGTGKPEGAMIALRPRPPLMMFAA